MSKELTPLKAHKELKSRYGKYFSLQDDERAKVIETALKDYELLKERTKLDSFECLLRLEEILPRGKELLVPVAKELKRKQDLEQMLHKMNVKHGYEEYLKINKALEIIKEKEVLSVYLDFYGCHLVVNNTVFDITPEEYDLLKED